MMRALAIVAMLPLSACAVPVKYVPIEIKLPLPVEPPECRDRETRPIMKPFPATVAQFPTRCGGISDPAQCVNLAWARHEAGASAVDRRNANRQALCTRYLDSIKAGNN